MEIDLSWVGVITGTVGALSGVVGGVLGGLSFFRDKPNVQITLQWDMKSFNTDLYDPDKLWCVVSVTNIGRRPIFVSHVALETHVKEQSLFLPESMYGDKLLEGDPPKRYVFTQEGLVEYSSHWQKIRAVISDSTGKKYYSKQIKNRPSWAQKK